MRTYSPGDEPIPGYRLIEQLGQGSFGVVWQAEGPGGVLVAMKVISNLNGIHAIREWQSLQNVMNLKQANLVEIYGVWLKDEEGRVLKPDEVRALIPPEVDVAAPVTETSSASVPAVAKKALWAGDKRQAKPAAAHQLAGATLQPEDDPQTAVPQAGSTAADSSRPADAAGSSGSSKESTSAKDSAAAKGSAASGSRGKWSKVGGVPPLELVSAMTLGEGTLMSRLKQCQAQGHKGIPRPELTRYMVEAAKGLAYLNDRNMHHCDVKPENLLLVGGSVKVCDYGSALRSIYSAESRTHQGYTEQYAAPEQLSGRKVKLHATTDMYALALTYYALRTGKYPWGELATEPIAVVKYGEKFDFSALASQSRYPYEWQVIRKALKREPDERHASALEFVEKLEAAARREEEAARARRRRRIRNVALAALMLLLIGGGIAAWIKRDEIAGLLNRKSSKDVFNSAVVENDIGAAVKIANSADPPLDAADVEKGITASLQNLAADSEQAGAALQEVLQLKSEYRQQLLQPVADLGVRHFQAAFKDQIADGDYKSVLSEVAAHAGLNDWALHGDVREALVELWLAEGQTYLAKAADNWKHAPDHARPLAALANALADEPARQAEIDGVAQAQFSAWLSAAESNLLDMARVPRARDEFHGIGSAAESYVSVRSGAPVEIRTQQASAQLGALAARYRLKGEPPAKLIEGLSAIKDAELASSPSALRRRILLLRALGPADDPELVGEAFLRGELPKLRGLPPGWEQEALDEIKKRAKQVAEKRHQAGQLANIDDVLKALEDDRLTLDFARDALAAAADAADQPEFDEALDLARKRLSRLPEKLEDSTNEQARSVLAAWLSLLAADAPAAGQVADVVQAFEAWDASAGGDARAAAWYPELVAGVARRPHRWPKEFLSAEIAELESRAANTSRIDRHVVALALRSQRLLVLAMAREPAELEFTQIEEDSGRLVAARDDENDGTRIGRFISPPVLVDALWGETTLASLALSGTNRPAIEPDMKAALDRLAAHVKNDPSASSATQADVAAFLRYVVDLYRVIAPPPGDALEDVLEPPTNENPWLGLPRRRMAAAALLLELADRAGTVSLARGEDPATFSDAFARQLPRLKRAQAWAAAGSAQQIAIAARAALAFRYAPGNRDWKAIKDASAVALADRAACQKAVSPAHYTHLLLVHAEALRETAAGSGADDGHRRELVSILAELLRRDCDFYDANQGTLADADLYERVASPALALIGDGSGNGEFARADLAVIYGAVGTLLERDSRRRIAVDHYDFNSGPKPYTEALRGSFRRASELDDDQERILRWLAGEAMALDREAELMPREDYSGLVKDLESIAGRMEELDSAWFAAPALRGLAAFYSAPKVNDLADLEKGEKQRAAALAGFQQALLALERHPRALSPWCRTWRSTLQRLASHICLQQSWNLTWGTPMQAKLQEAIKFASDAKRSAPDALEEAAAASTLGNAYEDMAFYLKCLPFYDRAEQEFHQAQEAVKAIDPFQEFLFRRNLIRVQYRRLSHDRSISEAMRKEWKQKLPQDMEQLLEDTAARGLSQYQTFTEYWLADMLSTLKADDVVALSRAEELFKKMPASASAAAKAKRYYLAGDCAMRLVVLLETAPPGLADAAADRARRYAADILPLEREITDAGTRSAIALLRADIAADRQDTTEGQFAQYVAERERSLAVGGLSPQETVKLQIELHLMVAATTCNSEPDFATRKLALDEVFRLLTEKRDLLSELERATLRLRATRIALDRAAAYHRSPRATTLPALELLALGKQAIDAARQAEQNIGQVECCAAPQETPVAIVPGFDSIWETRDLRLLIAHALMKPIFDGRNSNPGWKGELNWIKAQLEELKKALPRDGAQAETLRTRIDNDYLRQLARYLQ